MANPQPVKMGISSGAVRNIPKEWDSGWFRAFITHHMQNMDIRNTIAGPGIVITGTEQLPGTISTTALTPSANGNYTIPTPVSGVALTINGVAGQPALSLLGSGLDVGAGLTDQGAGTINVLNGIYINGVLQSKYVVGYHTAAQQNRASTITLAVDNYLNFPAVPAGSYRIRGMLQFSGSITGTQGAKFQVNIAGSVSGPVNMAVQGVVNGAAFPPVLFTGSGAAVSLATISTATSTDFIQFELAVTTTTPGAIGLWWAQNSTSANATLLAANAYMDIEQLN